MHNAVRFNKKFLVNNRHIRIFLSSTFSDMGEERTELVKTFEILKLEAAKRDIHLSIIDLRWGITDEECTSGKLISVCLEEVEHSHPFFIGILGNNYGTIPKRTELEKNPELLERYPWLDNAISDKEGIGMSITEMEIQYGVLRNKDDIDAAFFFRKSNEPDNNPRLTGLKNKIRERFRPYDYTTPSEFCEKVIVAVSEIIKKYFPEDEIVTPLNRERIAQRAYINSRHSCYFKRQSDFEDIDSFINSDTDNLIFTGDSGIGKSALLANWIKINEDNHDFNLVYHFVGNSFSDNGYKSILQHICAEIYDLYNINKYTNTFDDIEKEANRLLSSLLNYNKKLVIIIDGINKIKGGDKLLLWLPQANNKVKQIFSTIESDETFNSLKRREKYKNIKIKPLTKAECINWIPKYLGIYGKKLKDTQIEYISQHPICQNPLILRTLLDELICFGSHKELNMRIEYYLSASYNPNVYQTVINHPKTYVCKYQEKVRNVPIDIHSPINTPQYNVFFNLILQRFENDYSANQELVRHALTLISVSEHGLSEDEIISILKCRPIDWHLFFCAFYNNFLISNGLISFSHKYIIEAINERYKIKYLQSYVDDEAKVILCRHEIIDYCSTNDSYRSLKEKAYQFYKLNEWENLFKILFSIKGFVVFYNNNRDTLERYWLSLSINGYSTEVYISQLEDINGDARIEILTILSKFAIYNNTNRTVADFCTQELVSNSNNLSELDYMNALIIRGDCVRMFNGDLKLAKFLYKRALEIATNHNISALIIQQRLLSTDYELSIDGMNNSAQETITVLEQICVKIAHQHGSESYEYATFLTQRGLFAHKSNNYTIALNDLLVAHNIYEKLIGKNSFDYTMSLCNIGLVYADIPQKIEKAFAYLWQAREVIYNLVGDIPNKYTAQILDNLAYAYGKQGEYTENNKCFKEAFKYQKMALENYLEIFRTNIFNTLIAECYWNMSYYKERTGEIKYAYEYMCKYHKIACFLYEREDQHIQQSLYKLCVLHSLLNV